MKKLLIKNRIIISVFMIVLLAALLVPALPVFATAHTALILTGSTTVGPIIANGQSTYNTASPGGTTITQINQVGSGAGITAVSNGSADIGMSSRDLKSSDPAGLTAHAIARDGICIIVNGTYVPSQIAQITKAQLKGIYEGSITNWNQINSAAASTTIYPRARNIGSGTRSSILDQIGLSDPYPTEQSTITATGLDRLDTNETMQAAIQGATTAQIGYVGLGFDSGSHIRTIPVINDTDHIAYLATPFNVYSWRYPLGRYLYLITRDSSDNLANETACTNWWANLDGQGQNYVVSTGFLRLIPDADVTADGHLVNILDLSTVGNFVGQSGAPHWTRADVNRDGTVNILDFSTVGNWMGTSLDRP